MASATLRRLLLRDRDVSGVVAAVIASLGAPLTVTDAAGAPLLGEVIEAPRVRLPIRVDGDIVGWVTGDGQAETVAALLTLLARTERDRKSLALEALDRYRELSLLYELSEKLGSILEVFGVLDVAVNELGRRVTAGTPFGLLLGESGEWVAPVALGKEVETLTQLPPRAGIIGAVAVSGRAEIVNDTPGDPRSHTAEKPLRSLLCAPLQSGERVIGVLAVADTKPVEYTAGDLKFLTAIASQVAPAIDHAILHERTVREARERELALQQQLAAMRIDINQSTISRQVSTITGTEYFKRLREQAEDLRRDLDV